MKKKEPMANITIRANKTIIERMEELAKLDNRTPSDFMRKILIEGVEYEEEKRRLEEESKVKRLSNYKKSVNRS